MRSFLTTMFAITLSTGCLVIAPSANAQGNDYKAFQKWAVEYCLSQQRASKFRLDEQEAMNISDLRQKLPKPWRDRYNAFVDPLYKLNISVPERNRRLEAFQRQEDAAMMKQFQDYLRNGRMSEAYIYHGMFWLKEDQKKASRDAYDVCIRSFEIGQKVLDDFVRELTPIRWKCKSRDGKTTSECRVVTKGVTANKRLVQELYDRRAQGIDFPFFPELQVEFRLSDDSEAPYDNFVFYDIRHSDRTLGDRLKEGLEYFSGNFGAYGKLVYLPILKEKGMEAAKKAFRDNLILEQAEIAPFADGETRVPQRSFGIPVSVIGMHFHMNRCSHDLSPSLMFRCFEFVPGNAQVQTPCHYSRPRAEFGNASLQAQ